MAPTGPDLLRLSLVAHEAAVEPSVWPTFLAGYARLIDADVTVIQRHYLSQHRSELLATFGMTDRFTASYNNHYSGLNVWREHGRHLYTTGRINFDPEMYPRPLLKRSEFYNDYLLPNGGTHCIAGVAARRGDEVLMLTALRQDRKDGWDEHDRATVAALLPHVARARETTERLSVLEGGEAALNTLGLGVLLLAADGSVVFCNRAAVQIVANAGDGLALRNGRMAASDPDVDTALQRVIRNALSPGESIVSPPDVLVPRLSLERPYHVTASPLRRTLRPFTGMTTPVVVVLIVDPALRRPIASEALRRTYGLTPKEAALALALGEGHTLEQAAAQLTMRYETARTHLRRILSKTETHRQAELIKLLERLSH
jgi:DNA-binding CsgD family transcriptional regulator/PAS domain-containing protein